MWRNHHAITILNFLVGQIVAMNLKFDSSLINQEIAIDTVIKKALTPLLPPFSKGRLYNASVIFPLSSVPAGLYCIFK